MTERSEDALKAAVLDEIWTRRFIAKATFMFGFALGFLVGIIVAARVA